MGDFNGWDRASHPLTRREGGVWEIELAGADALQHGQRVKLQIRKGGQTFDRIPSYIHRAVQDKETNQFVGQIWAPPRPFH